MASLSWLEKVILAKRETVYATDPVPVAATDAVMFTASNVKLSPMEGDDVSRDIARAYMGAHEMFPVNLRQTLSFDTELAGSGTAGTAPPWGALARGCGLSETISAGVSVTYAPVSSSFESLAHYFFNSTTRYVLSGARGTLDFALDAQGIPNLTWNYTGLFAAPGEQAKPAPVYTSWKTPLVANTTNTPTFSINGVALVLKSFKFSQGNDVQSRQYVRRDEILIVDRKPSITAVVEAVPVTTLNPFALANSRTTMAVSLVHGTAAGNIATWSFPTCQLQRPAGPEGDQNVSMWTLVLTPRPNAGNDEFTLTMT